MSDPFARALRILVVLLAAMLAVAGWQLSPALARSAFRGEAALTMGPDDDDDDDDEGGDGEGKEEEEGKAEDNEDDGGDEGQPNPKPKPDTKPKPNQEPKPRPDTSEDPKPKPKPKPDDDADQPQAGAKEKKGQAGKRRRLEKRQRRQERRQERRHDRRQERRHERRERRRTRRHARRHERREARRVERGRSTRGRDDERGRFANLGNNRSGNRSNSGGHEQASARASGHPSNRAAEGRRNHSPKAKHSKRKRGSLLGLGSNGKGRGDSASDEEGIGAEADVKGSFVEALVQGGNEIDGSASVALVKETDEHVAQPEPSGDGTGLPLTGFQQLVMLLVGLTLILIGTVLYGSAVGHRSIDNARLWTATKRSIHEWRQTSKRWRFGP